MRGEEITPWLRAATALVEDQDSVSSTHTGWLTTAWNSSSEGSDALFWAMWVLHTVVHTQTSRHTYTKMLFFKRREITVVAGYN